MKITEQISRWKIVGSLFAVSKPKRLSEKSMYSQVADSDTDSLLESGSENSFAQRRSTPSSWTYRAVTTLIFALFNIAFLVTIWFYPTKPMPYDVTDYIFPQVGYETVVFHDDHILPSEEGDKIWTDQLPHGNGFTILDNPERYGLPQGQAYGDGFNRYGVSWAHQYHCIWMLRDAFWNLVNNKSDLVGVDPNEKSKQGGELWHLAHCFGYLRQHVVCNMDMTLEWPTLKGPNAGVINGYEIPHQCKKREQLDEYMDRHGPKKELLRPVHMPVLPSHEELLHQSLNH